jgi:hypothetical protein
MFADIFAPDMFTPDMAVPTPNADHGKGVPRCGRETPNATSKRACYEPLWPPSPPLPGGRGAGV